MAMKLAVSNLFIWAFVGVSFLVLQLYSIYMILSVTNPALDLPSNDDTHLTPAPPPEPAPEPSPEPSPVIRQWSTERYGPFRIPALNATSSGMQEFNVEDLTMPCRECLVSYMQADLIHEDGSVANVNTGLWLHHMVLLNPAKPMITCPEEEDNWEVFYGAGNERTVMDFEAHSSVITGYILPPAEVPIVMSTELMSTLSEETNAYLTLKFGFYPLDLLENTPFHVTTPVWLDVDACGNSEVDPPAADPVFEVPGWHWPSTISGNIIDIGMHGHDGVTQLQTSHDDKMICDVEVQYGENEMYIEAGVPEGGADSIDPNSMESKYGRDWEHISSIAECHDPGRIEVGQLWTVKAQYNFSAHAPMVDTDGKLAQVMAIAMLMVVEDD